MLSSKKSPRNRCSALHKQPDTATEKLVEGNTLLSRTAKAQNNLDINLNTLTQIGRLLVRLRVLYGRFLDCLGKTPTRFSTRYMLSR